MYNIVAICGEAGAGKDTVMQKILAQCNDYKEIISCTTRPIREYEKQGINYYYLTDVQFEENIDNNEMLEYTKFNGWYYGTNINQLKKDAINIGVFNPEGIRQLAKDPRVNLFVIRVRAAAKTRLMRQLSREANPNVDEIIRRYQTDINDFAYLEFPHYTVSNEDSQDLVTLSHVLIYNINTFFGRPLGKED